MTIHSAKGLEFPMVIVSGLTTRVVRPAQGVQVLWPGTGGYELRLGSRAQTADYEVRGPPGRGERLGPGGHPAVAGSGPGQGPARPGAGALAQGSLRHGIGRAVHGVLQQVDLATGRGLADAVAAQYLAEGVVPLAGLVSELVSSALAAPLIRREAARPHWRESYVATTISDRVLEGLADLLFRDDDGLVVVDHRTDAVPLSALSGRVDFYRPQLAAYAAAVEAAVGEQVARCVLLFLSPTGAEAREVPHLPAAITAVRAAVLA